MSSVWLAVVRYERNRCILLNVDSQSYWKSLTLTLHNASIWVGQCQFLRATAGTAVAHLSHRNSVCPFVHLSHGWISQKWCKLGSPNLHCRLPGRLQFQEP